MPQLSTDKDQKTLFILGSKKMQKWIFGRKLTPIDYKAEMKLDLDKEREFMFNYVQREEKERFYHVDMHGVDLG